jgi:tripartite-type tricarboxylate transporter receptor subunit TctC
MNRDVKIVAIGAAAAAVCVFQPAGAAEQPYPARAVRVLVGLAPGGGTDTVARLITAKLAEAFGQSFVIDNRPGAGGNVVGELAARATPDGYTLITVTPTHVINPSLYRDVRYDAIKDFSAVARLTESQYYLSISNALPASTLAEFLAFAKSSPKPISYASSGIGSANHLSGELFRTMSGLKLVHVPYKGGAPALNALLAGEVQMSFTSSAALPLTKAGKLKTLASTGAKRSTAAPDLPTIAEAGIPGYVVVGWYGMAAPVKTPRAVIEKLNAAINRALPELKERYEALGMEITGGTAEAFGTFLRAERDRWAEVVKISGAKAE